MRLSKKLLLIFIVSTILSLGFFQVMTYIMINKMYKGESERMSGITGGVVTRFNSEVASLKDTIKDYGILYSAALQIDKEFSVNDGEERVRLLDKMKSDEIYYEIFLNRNFTLEKLFRYSSLDMKEVETLLGELNDVYKDRDKNYTYVIKGLNYQFIVAVSPVFGENKEIIGYMVLGRRIDETLALKIGQVLNRKVYYKLELENPSKAEDGLTDHKEPIINETLEDKVLSYYKIISTDGSSAYFQVDETLAIKKSASRSIKLFSAFISVAFLIVNLLLFESIRKIIIKRIMYINNEVKKVTSKAQKNINMKNLKGKDEVYHLSSDISTMISSLENTRDDNEKKEKKYRMLISSLTNGFLYFKIIRDENGKMIDGQCVEVNEAALNILNIEKERILNNYISAFSTKKYNYLKYLKKYVDGKRFLEKTSLEAFQFTDDIWVSLGLYSVEDDYFAMVISDITKTKTYSEKMTYLANYDTVTNLKNRYGIVNHMKELIKSNKGFTIYYIDLDNFKSVNDYLGHTTGDEVLCGVSKILLGFSEDKTTIGRIGGDEFIIVKEKEMSDSEKLFFGNEFLKALNQTLKYKNYTYLLRASVGISAFPTHGDDIESLLKYADIAMYRSKKDKNNKVQIISKDMMDDIIIEGVLNNAIAKKQFIVYYQPIYDINNDKIVGAEALVRWEKDGKIVLPEKFISIAKKNGEILNLDDLVLRNSIKMAKELRKIEKIFQVSVNASYVLLKKEGFVSYLTSLLKEENLEPSALKIEITEDEVLDNPKYIIGILRDIKMIGVKISLDDFGYGYSSFNHVKLLPIDTIKIDKSLLDRLDKDEKSKAIIETIINLSHTLQLDVICEGVETKEQLEYLKSINCDKIQGYYISRPVPIEKFVEITKSRRY